MQIDERHRLSKTSPALSRHTVHQGNGVITSTPRQGDKKAQRQWILEEQLRVAKEQSLKSKQAEAQMRKEVATAQEKTRQLELAQQEQLEQVRLEKEQIQREKESLLGNLESQQNPSQQAASSAAAENAALAYQLRLARAEQAEAASVRRELEEARASLQRMKAEAAKEKERLLQEKQEFAREQELAVNAQMEAEQDRSEQARLHEVGGTAHDSWHCLRNYTHPFGRPFFKAAQRMLLYGTRRELRALVGALSGHVCRCTCAAIVHAGLHSATGVRRTHEPKHCRQRNRRQRLLRRGKCPSRGVP